MSTILITGGLGFIGSHLSKKLLADGHEVRVIDLLSPQVHGDTSLISPLINHAHFSFIRGSILDRSLLQSSLLGVDCVVHLAAETGTGQSMYQIEKYCETNILGTALLLDLLVNSPDISIKRFFLASSRSVYGEGAYICPMSNCLSESRIFPGSRTSHQLASHSWEPLCPNCSVPLQSVATREIDVISPSSIYASSKYSQEELVRITCKSIGVDCTVLRLQNVYGEGQSLSNPYTGILSIFSTRIRRGLELPIFEDGMETRDFVHVDDVVKVFSFFINLPNSFSGVLNVGSGVPLSVYDVANKLVSAFDSDVSIRVTGEYRLGDIRHNFADITLLQTFIPSFPSITIDQGLVRFVKWVLTKPIPHDKLDQANNELKVRNLMA